jgi:hypothetical protein
MHLLATHLFHTHTSNMSHDISQLDSEVTKAIRITIHHAIATLTQQNTLPYHAIPIIHLLATLGGLGIATRPYNYSNPSLVHHHRDTFTSVRYSWYYGQ